MLSSTEVVRRLKAEGFEVGPAYIGFLIREGHLAPPENRVGNRLVWLDADIDRLRRELERRGRVGKPHAGDPAEGA